MTRSQSTIHRYLLLAILIVILLLFFGFGGYRYLSFTMLQQHYQQLQKWQQHYALLTLLGFCLLYVLITAISIPGAMLLTITAGLLFGPWLGTIAVVISASLGASLIFMATKTALADALRKRSGTLLSKISSGFKNNAFNYLLFLRLVPLFPFWIINIAAGLLGIRFVPFFWATLLGITPATAIYVSVGNTLNTLLVQQQKPNLDIIFKPAILVPLLALSVLVLLPVLYKKWQGKKKDKLSINHERGMDCVEKGKTSKSEKNY